MHCNVCYAALGDPLYEAISEQALTSLCELRPGRVRVWLCPSCGHQCSEALSDTRDYYESDYRILLDHDDEDQIYDVKGARIVYRTDHQVDTLLAKISLPKGARMLDYGCAKAATPRRLLASRQDLQVYLFDVSEMYIRYWQQFLPEGRWAIHDTPAKWHGGFDVVTSFFALEHIPEPLVTVRRIASLLTDDGVFYGIVPDAFGNVADFVVIDHVNHFTNCSLHVLLRSAGFTDIRIDADVHRGALVFEARKTGSATIFPDLGESLLASRQLAHYWAGLGEKVRVAEAAHSGLVTGIYGSGFYGAYIFSLLQQPGQVQCFLDASPYQQGKTLFGRPVLAPQHLPDSLRILYIGLNPKISRAVVAEMDWLQARNLILVYIEEAL